MAEKQQQQQQQQQQSALERETELSTDVSSDSESGYSITIRESDSEAEAEAEAKAEDDNSELARRDTDTLRDAERLFPWHGDQLALAERLRKSIELRDPDGNQLELLISLCKAFIFQKLIKDVYTSALVHFLSVLGINEEMGRLRTANDYSYMLAGMVYNIRVLAVESLLPSSCRASQGEAELDEFLEQRKASLADGSYGPMSTMISLLAYGKHIALNHGNAGMIDWPSEEVMTLHGQRIYMEKFRKMVHDVIDKAEHILWEELMWCSSKQERFEIPLDEVEDDVTFTKRGFSFTSKLENGLDKGLDWMLERMMKSDKGRKLRGNTAWQRSKVKQYSKSVDKFRELLLFLVHLTGGQLARGPEITSLRFKNGFFQDRNIFIISGQATTVTRYNKSQLQ